MAEAPLCCICGLEVEPWVGGGGYGHNPAPVYPTEGNLACNWCDENVVVPVRLHRSGVTRDKEPLVRKSWLLAMAIVGGTLFLLMFVLCSGQPGTG